ncbi:cell wall-associated NlpC family hydrolase [Paenibacillus phyllosphaerae]|uniref:Cell wall-associated NlpC family hydrolase n=1 Tax=Paenibacillus phyllosphaerae TaxID=274593 RepID=A0A7W5FL23_9BACL|nr:SH3 domain-containing C40 family peptidase [Paenibacillus phyllosphaerae]MBB3108584.1 cell wall-associated NlpC family hydrolase [Paenibacillus phyllosphaerae]
MKKWTALTMATIFAASLSAPLAASAATGTAEVQASVSFRTEPSTSSGVIRYLKSGESVKVISEVNSYWLQVQDSSGQVGYVSSNAKYIDFVEDSVTAPATATGNATVTSSASFRKSASASSTRIRYFSKGESVTILSQPNSYWYQVKDANGVVGYVDTDYVATSGTSTPSTSTPVVTAPADANAVINASVSFRTAASTSASRIRYLKSGEQVTVIGQPSKSWYQVRDGSGVVGYVSSDAQYITTSYSSAPVITNPSAAIESVIAAGMKYWGTPYEYSSDRNTTTTFDCSDFVRTAFRDALGLILPSDSRDQGTYVKSKGAVTTDYTQLKRGDLMFFMSYKGSKASSYSGVNKSTATITHVGIYLGNGQILHTYSTESGGVKISDIAGTHWEYRFLYGGSAL